MRTTKFLSFFLSFFLFSSTIRAQTEFANTQHEVVNEQSYTSPIYCPSILDNITNTVFLDSITYKKIGNKFRFLSTSFDYFSGGFYNKYKTQFGFSSSDNFKVVSIKDNIKGNVQITTYQHYRDGIEVEYSRMVEDVIGCEQYLLHGFVATNINSVGQDTIISKLTSREYFKNYIQTYYSDKMITSIKPIYSNISNTDCNYKFYFKITLGSVNKNSENNSSYDVLEAYYDPYDNTIIKESSLTAGASLAPGLNGDLTVEETANGNRFDLFDSQRKISIVSAHATQCAFCSAWEYGNLDVQGATRYTRASQETWFKYLGFWSDANRVTFQLFFNAGLVWDFFSGRFGLNGPGSGKNTELFLTANGYKSYAYLDGGGSNTIIEYIMIAAIDGASIFAIAHEWTHTVINRIGGPTRNGFESLCLNEGFCDVFGSMVSGDYFGLGRSLSNPTIDHYSKISMAQNEYEGSGILSKLYYLLNDGDTHYNININSIGQNNTESLFYDVMTTKLNGFVNYNEARFAFIASAIELFGPCSWELIEVTNALAAVGLGNQYSPGTWVKGKTQLCKENGSSESLYLTACLGAGFNGNENYDFLVIGNLPQGTHITTTNTSINFLFPPFTDQSTETFKVRITSPNGEVTYMTMILKDCDGKNTDPCKHIEYRSYNQDSKVDLKKDFGQDKSSLIIYPNPARDIINIKSIITQDKTLQIYDLKGNMVKNSIFSNTLDVSDLQQGMYLITSDGLTFSKFFKINN